MAKNVRISDELYLLALLESKLQDRSIAQQLEHWIKLGLSASRSPSRSNVVDAAIAITRGLDTQDVLEGKRSADYLHFIPRSIARRAKPVFPTKYRKS
jgi:hypothetical protein